MSNKLLPYYCIACDRQGNMHSLMSRGGPETIGANQAAGMMVVCMAGHKYPYDRFMALKPRMQKIAFNEKQPTGSMNQVVWIHPEALAGMQRRWPDNFLTTLYSLFNALAHQDAFIVEPEYAVELAKKGITKGREVMGLVTENDNLKNQILALEDRLKRRPGATSSPVADPRMDAIVMALAAKGIIDPSILAAFTPIAAAPAPSPAAPARRRNIQDGIDLDTGNYVGETETPEGGQFVESIDMPAFDEGGGGGDDLVEPVTSRGIPAGLPRPSTPLR